MKRPGDGKVRKESAEERTIPGFGSPQRERHGVNSGLEAHVEAAKCIIMESRDQMEIPDKHYLSQLFRGRQQRVAAARALFRDPARRYALIENGGDALRSEIASLALWPRSSGRPGTRKECQFGAANSE